MRISAEVARLRDEYQLPLKQIAQTLEVGEQTTRRPTTLPPRRDQAGRRCRHQTRSLPLQSAQPGDVRPDSADV